MKQKDFIASFVQKHPRLFIRFLSKYFPFTEQELFSYDFMLDWNATGLLTNKNIIWTEKIKSIYASKLSNKSFEPQSAIEEPKKKKRFTKEYITYKVYKNIKRIFPIEETIKLTDITDDFLRKNKEEIKRGDWYTISSKYQNINYDFITEFYDRIKLNSLLENPYFDWSDTRIYDCYFDNYHLIACQTVWDNFLTHHVNHWVLKEQLYSLNELDKFGKITWKSDFRLKDNTIKYSISIYAKTNYEHQVIACGYYYTEKDFALNKTFDIPRDAKFEISTQNSFGKAVM